MQYSVHEIITLSLLMAITAGCATNRSLQPYTETVMSPGMTIHATNRNGTVTITAGSGTQRTYTLDNHTVSRRLIARDTRWNGSLGLYDPASSKSPNNRIIIEEARLHFDSIDQALRHLYSGSAVFKPVYTNDGLVFGYGVSYSEHTTVQPVRSIQLFQLYINGSKPTTIPGANDQAITATNGTTPEISHPYPRLIGYELLFGNQPYQPQ